MRYIQENAADKPVKKEKKADKKEPVAKAGTKDYDYSNLGRNKPMLGGNYNGG